MSVVLTKDPVALEVLLVIHRDDKDMITKTEKVPRRIYAGSHKGYLSLRENVGDAVDRYQELVDGRVDAEDLTPRSCSWCSRLNSPSEASTSMAPPAAPKHLMLPCFTKSSILTSMRRTGKLGHSMVICL